MKRINIVLTACFLLFAGLKAYSACYETGQGACRYYVSVTNGKDDNYGISWNEAFFSIQRAIDEANGSAGHGVSIEVWVEQGLYNISSSIIMRDSVLVYGGFVGNETELTQRNTNPALTVIDAGSNGRVLTQPKVFTGESVWNGFTFQNGRFESITSSEIRGGGGVLLEKNGKLENCIIKNNVSNINGAGVYMNQGGRLLNCVIEGNSIILNTYGNTRQSGAGVFINSNATNTGIIESCEIINNQIAGESNTNSKGGGVYLNGGNLLNSLLQNNSAYQGGGVYAYASDGTGSSNVLDCKIINNLSHNVGGGIYSSILSNDAGVYPGIMNCLVAHNTSNTGSGGIHAANGTSTRVHGNRIINCTIVRNTTTGTNTSYAAYSGLYAQNANFVMNTIIWGNLAIDASTKRQFYAANNVNTRFINNAIQDLNNPGDFASNGTNVTKIGLLSLSPENNDVAFKSPSFVSGKGGEGWDVAEWILLDSSKCNSAGMAVYTINDFVAHAPEKDIAGTARDNPPAIGAYEATQLTNTKSVPFENQNRIMFVANEIVTNETGIIRVFSLTGNQIISSQTEGRLFINLNKGVYITCFIDRQGEIATVKIHVK